MKKPIAKKTPVNGKGKSTVKSQIIPEQLAAKVIKRKLADLTYDYMKDYGTITVEDRSIPDYRDGMKPVHRRVLWAMHTIGNGSKTGFQKCAKTVGATLGNFHPHGEGSIYMAMVGLINSPDNTIDGSGNFGDHSNPPAANRYTEARLSRMAEQMLLDPYYLRVTEMLPTFDNATLEPVILPAMLPFSLTTGSLGIAVGTTTNIPRFTLESVRNLVAHILKRSRVDGQPPVCTTKDCVRHLVFASKYGGFPAMNDMADFKPLFRTGGQRVVWSCEGGFDAKSKTFIVTGFADKWNVETGLERLSNINGVRSVNNYSAKGKINVVIDFQSAVEMKTVIPAIKRVLTISQTYRTNILYRSRVMNNDLWESTAQPKEVSIVDIVNDWLAWRVELELKALNLDVVEFEAKLDRLNLLKLASDNIKIIFDILNKRGVDKVKSLSTQLKITTEQAQYIWQLAVGRLDRLSSDEIKGDIAAVQAQIKETKVRIKRPLESVEQRLPKYPNVPSAKTTVPKTPKGA
jgi:DNA gyrase/topoisomerase IV subunit A